MQASEQPKHTAELPESVWPTTKAFISLIDGVHSYTGLPWWATLSLTAVGEFEPLPAKSPNSKHGSIWHAAKHDCDLHCTTGVRAALLPISVQQMRASAALWSTWRQAQQTAAARTASRQPRSNFSGTAASQAGQSAAGGAPSQIQRQSSSSGATKAAAPVVAWDRQQEGTLGAAAARAALRPPSRDQEAPPGLSNTIPDNKKAAASGTLHDSDVTAGKPGPAAVEPGMTYSGDLTGANVVSGQTVAGVSGQREESDGATGEGGQATSSRGGRAGPGPASLAATLAEYSRLRARSGAPHPAWIIGSPLIQVCCSATSSLSVSFKEALLTAAGVILHHILSPAYLLVGHVLHVLHH